MTQLRGLLCALLVTFGAGAAQATDRWTVVDLGQARREAHCLDAAQEALERADRVFGIERIERSSWTVYAFAIGGGPHDAVITCTFGANQGTRATLVIHSGASQVLARGFARTIAQAFRSSSKRLERIWLEEAKRRHGF